MVELGKEAQSALDLGYDLYSRVKRIAESLPGRRSIWLKMAYSCTLLEFCAAVITYEFKLIKEYIEEKSDLFVVLRRIDDGKVIWFPYVHRYSEDYRRKIRRKLYDILRYVQSRNLKYSVFITFTLRASDYMSQYQAKCALEKAWNSVLTRMRRKYPWTEFIRATEWQRNGLGVHLHVLVFGIGFIDKEWLMRTWAKVCPSGWAIELERVKMDFRNEGHAINYIAKYIVKQQSLQELDVSAVINGSLGSRSFSTSRMPIDLVLVETNSNGVFVFLGIVEAYIINAGVDAVLEHLNLT